MYFFPPYTHISHARTLPVCVTVCSRMLFSPLPAELVGVQVQVWDQGSTSSTQMTNLSPCAMAGLGMLLPSGSALPGLFFGFFCDVTIVIAAMTLFNVLFFLGKTLREQEGLWAVKKYWIVQRKYRGGTCLLHFPTLAVISKMFPPPALLWHSGSLQAIYKGIHFQQQFLLPLLHCSIQEQQPAAPVGPGNALAMCQHLWRTDLMVNTLASQSHHIYQCQEKVFEQPDFLIWLLPLPISFPASEEDFSDVGTTPRKGSSLSHSHAGTNREEPSSPAFHFF